MTYLTREQHFAHIGVKGMRWGVRKSVKNFVSDPKHQKGIAVAKQVGKATLFTAGTLAVASIAGPIVASGAAAAARALTSSGILTVKTIERGGEAFSTDPSFPGKVGPFVFDKGTSPEEAGRMYAELIARS